MVYLTSDLHLCHDREFVYKPRGFNSIHDMNEAIISNWNNIINPEDDIYVLGDLMLNDNDTGLYLLKKLKGKIHIVLGNHDTNTRIELYKNCWNVVEVTFALRLNYKGYHFFLTHFPCMTANLEKESLKKCTINLYGHTHQQTNFYNEIPFMYHVGVDSHNCTPISIEDIIKDMQDKVEECKKML